MDTETVVENVMNLIDEQTRYMHKDEYMYVIGNVLELVRDRLVLQEQGY